MDEYPHPKREFTAFDRYGLPIICLVAGIISPFLIDGTVARYFKNSKLPGDLKDFFDAAEHFGTPYGQLIGLLCLAAATGWKDRRVVRIFLGASTAGIAANILKLCVGRVRPKEFDLQNLQVLDSFVGWFPLHSGGSDFESFPSAHTASAFGFAALLFWAFPKGRIVFISLGFLVAMQRLSTSAHYPSDVLIGAMIGWTVGLLFTGSTWPGRKFDLWESKASLTSNETT